MSITRKKNIMNSIIITLSLAAALSVATATKLDYFYPVYETAHNDVVRVEAGIDKQLIRTVSVAYELDGHGAKPSLEQLVAKGYLSDEYLTRERVAAPIPRDAFNNMVSVAAKAEAEETAALNEAAVVPVASDTPVDNPVN
jgi:hypothetical protein